MYLNEELPAEVVPEERRATIVFQNEQLHVTNFKVHLNNCICSV